MPRQLGAQVRQSNQYIWVTLRSGRICETEGYPKVEGREELELAIKALNARDYFEKVSTNLAGQQTKYFAKEYLFLDGYINDIRWFKKEFKDGSQVGWNITIDTTEQVYILQINSNDRPYHHLMSCLLNVDFNEPVYFTGYLNEWNGKKYKNLLLSQADDPEPGQKREWIQPAYAERWMSQLIRDKIREGVELSDAEKKNVAFDKDGKPDNSYAYILEKQDGKWSFDKWDDFLIEKMKSEVIPSVKEAAATRNSHKAESPEAIDQAEAEAIADFAGPMTGKPANGDDDIPF